MAISPCALFSQEDEVEDIINGLVFSKTVAVFAELLDASKKTNNYIIVDRVDPRLASSPGADLLPELALQQVDEPPTTLVVESWSRLRAHEGEEANRQIEQLEEIRDCSWSRGQEGQEHKQPVEIDALYTARDFSSCEEFRGKSFAEWLLPREPEPTHVDASGEVEKDKRWSYHYNQYMLSSGTHYIILEDGT